MANATLSPPLAAPVGAPAGRPLDGRLLAWAPAVAVAIVVVLTAGHVIDWLAFDLDIDLLNADSDVSVYSWISTVSIFLTAIGMFVVDRFLRPAGLRRFLAPALAFLSLDEMVAIHEHLGRLATALGYSQDAGRFVWPLVYLPLIGGVALCLWRFADATVARGGRNIRLGLVLLGSAVLLEMGSTKLADGQHGRWAYELEVIVEQNFELVGWSLIGLAAVAAAIRLLGGRALR